ncbi:MAG: hypothetical protein NTY03_02565 [Candidatus Bathyarchaeota archaeon]|nr:hypothetical protein [Candidatus Bathyarchaeota archaeon]
MIRTYEPCFTFVVVSLVGSAATTGLSILIESYGPRILFPASGATLIPCVAMIHLLSARVQQVITSIIPP